MNVSRSTLGSCLVVCLEGRLAAQNVGSVRGELTAALKTAKAAILLDLSGVESVDLAGLSLLLRFYREAEQTVQAISLCAPPAHVLRLIELTRLHRQFRIYDSRERALEYIDHVA